MNGTDQVWARLDLVVPPAEYEALVGLLLRFDTCGFQEETGTEWIRVTAFFPATLAGHLQEQFDRALHLRGMKTRATASTLQADPQDWVSQCRHRFKGFPIGETFYVQPDWEEPVHEVPIRLILEPGQAFGTGTHESTQLALRHLETAASGAGSILDVGTGSGILAIAAARLQPRASLVALDIDEAASRTALANCRKNGVPQVRVLAGGPEALRSRWSLVMANLTRNILGDLREELARVTSRTLIVSGFLDEQKAEVADHFTGLGFEVSRELSQGGWSSLLLTRWPGGVE